mgnify:CR=1 FL=1
MICEKMVSMSPILPIKMCQHSKLKFQISGFKFKIVPEYLKTMAVMFWFSALVNNWWLKHGPWLGEQKLYIRSESAPSSDYLRS